MPWQPHFRLPSRCFDRKFRRPQRPYRLDRAFRSPRIGFQRLPGRTFDRDFGSEFSNARTPRRGTLCLNFPYGHIDGAARSVPMQPSQRGLPVVVNTGRRKPCLIPMVGVVANRLYTHLKAASTLFAVGDVPVERVGWLSHSLQQGAHVARSDPKSKVLRHPCGHLIARQAFGNKFLKIVDMSDVPSCASCHVMNLVGRSIPCNGRE